MSLLNTIEYVENPVKYIGTAVVLTKEVIGIFESKEENVLNEMHAAIGGEQVTIKRMESASSWKIRK